jgi:hypothetical protein
MELLAIWQGVLSSVFLLWMGTEGADGAEFIGEWGLLGCGVAVMEQMTQGSKHDKGRGLVLPVVGALQKGSGGGGGAHGGGHACRGQG